MAKVDEIAPDVFRISVFVPAFNLQFNHFLVKDDEPLLFHAGYRMMFDEIREAMAKVIDPATLRWVGFSHFESDECGSLNRWLAIAPRAQAVCSLVSALVSVNDFADRPPRGMSDGEVLETGKHRFRFCSTAHLPHGWDAGLLFEETRGTLLCSDLFHHEGDVEPVTESDVVGRSKSAMLAYQAGPLANYVPYTPMTQRIFEKLAALEPRTLGVMHGSSFTGNVRQALLDLGAAFREVLGG